MEEINSFDAKSDEEIATVKNNAEKSIQSLTAEAYAHPDELSAIFARV